MFLSYRIKRIEAEIELEKATKMAQEAFESARKIGVMMYDQPNPTPKSAGPITPNQCQTLIHHEFEPSSYLTSSKSTHKITASFETPFEVDCQVAAAVKKAFLQLTLKEELKELLWKISQNPEDNETGTCFPKVESESSLVDIMLVRLRGLKEEEMTSLAEIVATCGLNAALSEVDTTRINMDKRYKFDVGFEEHDTRNKDMDVKAVPSLDKFLVKHVSRLEREVEEAKKNKGHAGGVNWERVLGSVPSVDSEPGLGSILVKRMSKLEREVYEAKRNSQNSTTGPLSEKDLNVHEHKVVPQNTLLKKRNEDMGSQPGLGEILTRHKLKTQKAKLSSSFPEQEVEVAEHTNHIIDKRKSRERELMEAWGGLSLANSMRPRLSRLEREKVTCRMAFFSIQSNTVEFPKA